jgi:N-acetylornithine carbamoyltransferase
MDCPSIAGSGGFHARLEDPMNPHDVIDGTELGRDGVTALAKRALDLRAGAKPLCFPGKRVIGVFLNSSLRTRTSLEAAAQNLGMHSVTLHPGGDAWKMEHREGAVMDGDAVEHMADGVPVLDSYGDVLAVRAFAKLENRDEDRRDPVIAAFRRYAKVPVVNLESALWHPLQSFADAATWISHLGTDLHGKRLTLTWAPHPKALPMAVPNQVLLTAALLGMDVTVAHPEGMDLDPAIVDRAATIAAASDGKVRVVHDQARGLAGAQVVVAKSWSGWNGYGRREDEARIRAGLGGWTVTPEKMARTDAAGFMHCLPVRRNVEVADAVIDGPRSWTTETATLRLWTAMAALEAVLGDRPWTA